MKTWNAKPGEVERRWYLVDAEGKTLGRLATQIADTIRGKTKPEYTPHVEGALDACQLQRRERELTVRRAWEVALDRPAVEPGRAVAGLEDHACHRGLALPGSSVLRELAHDLSSSSFGACASCGCSGPA